jgi:hypothetical protein
VEAILSLTDACSSAPKIFRAQNLLGPGNWKLCVGNLMCEQCNDSCES